MSASVTLKGEAAMLAFAAQIAQIAKTGGLIFLHGTLGAGKTTLSRGMIQALGHVGAVKSPTYTLVEEYELGSIQVYHFDLYRLGDPEELEFMGIREYIKPGKLCLIEWPEKGQDVLPSADLEIQIDDLRDARAVRWSANTELGQAWANALDAIAAEHSA